MSHGICTPASLLARQNQSCLNGRNFVGQTQLQKAGKLTIAIAAASHQVQACHLKARGQIAMAQGRSPGDGKRLFQEQRDIMAPILDHLVLLVAARMIGHHLCACVQTHAEWISLQRQALIGILNRC